MACRGSGVRVPSAPPHEKAGARAPAFCHSPVIGERRPVQGEPSPDECSGRGVGVRSGRWHHVLMTATDVSTHHAPSPSAPPPTSRPPSATPRTTTTRCPVVLAEGDGAWVIDVDGKRYLDCLAGYSALNFGHSNERLVAVAREQLGRLTLTSRAFFNDKLSGFAEALCRLTGKDMILPMNSGAEAVETAIKVSRKWGYEVKGVPGRPGLDHHHGGQLPRPHHDDRELLRRRGRHLRLRPVHHRLPRREVRRHRGRSPRPSTRPPSRSSSSRSRARAAWSCRPRASCATSARSAPSATC